MGCKGAGPCFGSENDPSPDRLPNSGVHSVPLGDGPAADHPGVRKSSLRNRDSRQILGSGSVRGCETGEVHLGVHLGALGVDLGVDLGALGALGGGLAALGDSRQNKRDRTSGWILCRTSGIPGRTGSVGTTGIVSIARSKNQRDPLQNKRDRTSGSSAEQPESSAAHAR